MTAPCAWLLARADRHVLCAAGHEPGSVRGDTGAARRVRGRVRWRRGHDAAAAACPVRELVIRAERLGLVGLERQVAIDYAPCERWLSLLRTAPAAPMARQLVDLARLPSGDLQDDATVVVVSR